MRIRSLFFDIPTCSISLKRTRVANEDIGYRISGQHCAHKRTLEGFLAMHNKARRNGLRVVDQAHPHPRLETGLCGRHPWSISRAMPQQHSMTTQSQPRCFCCLTLNCIRAFRIGRSPSLITPKHELAKLISTHRLQRAQETKRLSREHEIVNSATRRPRYRSRKYIIDTVNSKLLFAMKCMHQNNQAKQIQLTIPAKGFRHRREYVYHSAAAGWGLLT